MVQMVYEVESEDLMKKHWDQECDNPLSELGYERIKQQAFNKH